ncbi:MAG: nucleotide sugar dehydrogenase [bacterium]|nr:nucleotide sugar dehydrogenase [bacterium]
MSKKISIVGLGYVGLPLAHAFAKAGHTVVGYDINKTRITDLQSGEDITGELTEDQLNDVTIQYSSDPSAIGDSDIVILALPTPVDSDNKPDLSILKAATASVAEHMKDGAIVVFESTVYPGTTEEICGPILRATKSCTLGYSPERINPGDKEHTIDKIIKVVAGEDDATTDTLVELYESIVTAGVHRAPSIKVAEMAKAIENAQRDLNIAFVNEVAVLSNAIGISSKDVLEAAKTKWNFLPFTPGLVGGHCIGVDPYYLVEKAKQLNMETQVIAAGRSVNDGMGAHVAAQIHDAIGDAQNILVLGKTFKENVPDTRNSQSMTVVKALEGLGHTVFAFDHYAGGTEKPSGEYDVVALLVPHKEFNQEYVISLTKEGGLIYDLKSKLDKKKIEASGRKYLAL